MGDPLTRHARSAPIVMSLAAVALALACAGSSPGQAGPGQVRQGQARHGQVRQGQARRQGGGAGTAIRAARALAPPRRGLRIRRAAYRLPVALSGEVASPDGSHLIVAGGLLADQSGSSAVVRIDVRTGTSSAAGQLALPVHDAACAVLGGRLLVFGGGTGDSYATVQRFSRADARYSALYGALPAPRSDLTAVSAGHTVYLAGGHGNSGYARAVLATTDGRHFRSVAMLPVPVRYPAVAVVGGDLWVFGGLTPRGPVADVQRVNLRTGQAQRAGRLPRPLEAGSAFTLAGTIYVAGGTTIGSPGTRGGARPLVTSSVVRRFAPRNRAFQIVGRLPAPVSHAAVAVTGGVAYLVGGLDGSQTVRTISTLRLGGSAGLVGKP